MSNPTELPRHCDCLHHVNQQPASRLGFGHPVCNDTAERSWCGTNTSRRVTNLIETAS